MEIFLGGDLGAAMSGAAPPPLPDVLAFQEMTRLAWGYARHHLGAAGFHCYPDTPPDREDYTLLAVRPPWRLADVSYRAFTDGGLRRGCLSGTLHRDDLRVRMLSGHMESLRSGAEARLGQAREIDGWLHESSAPAFFVGDTNLRDTEWKVLRPTVRALDAYELMGRPPSGRVTWWSPRGHGFRFDRAWLSAEGQTPHLRPLSMKLRRAGKASDHAGLELALALPG